MSPRASCQAPGVMVFLAAAMVPGIYAGWGPPEVLDKVKYRRDLAGMGSRELERRVEVARRFNRFYTRQIGLLRRGAYDSPFSLTEVRVLYELAHRDQPTATELGRDLGLDAGYLSRILRGFEKRALVTRTRSAADGRQSHLALTALGRKVFAPLDARSHAEVAALLSVLAPAAQAQVIAAMQTIERLLGRDGPPPPASVLRPSSSPRCSPSSRFSAATACRPPPTCCAHPSRATWAGWCTATAPCTRASTATTRSSKRWSRRSWRASFNASIRLGSGAGSRNGTARWWGRCSWWRDRARSRSCACSWSSRRRAARASGLVS